MRMTSLKALHRDMLDKRLDVQQFALKAGSAEFDCMFTTRTEPHFELSLTTKGANPKFFLFEVKPGYYIAPYFEGFYQELVEVLSSGANSGQTLYPKNFLSQLNDLIPTQASLNAVPSNHDIIKLRPDLIEDRDKPYFDHWKCWTDRKPSKDNLKKTLHLLGSQAHQYSDRMNASSCWTATNKHRS